MARPSYVGGQMIINFLCIFPKNIRQYRKKKKHVVNTLMHENQRLLFKKWYHPTIPDFCSEKKNAQYEQVHGWCECWRFRFMKKDCNGPMALRGHPCHRSLAHDHAPDYSIVQWPTIMHPKLACNWLLYRVIVLWCAVPDCICIRKHSHKTSNF